VTSGAALHAASSLVIHNRRCCNFVAILRETVDMFQEQRDNALKVVHSIVINGQALLPHFVPFCEFSTYLIIAAAPGNR